MILSGPEIQRQRENGNIVIEPWNDAQLNPNSYNVRLHNELVVYEHNNLDMGIDNPYSGLIIPETGYWLKPGILYLGRTVEYTETHGLVPMIEGRSSIGRLGLFVHVTAGFGDDGFKGYWTLELMVAQPLMIYPGVEIAQIFYHTVDGDRMPYKESGKYQGNTGIQTSKLWKELQK